MNILRNIEKPEQINKIQNALNNLNVKVIKFNEQRMAIEDEIKKGIHASTASLMSA